MSKEVKLEKFEGPLDLLLQLIEREEMSISEISLSQVTEQFFNYLNGLENEQPEELADFLVIATRLVYLKSKNLLPHLQTEEAEGPSLADQLKMYKRYVDASKIVEKLWMAGKVAYGRIEPSVKPEGFLPPLNAAMVDLQTAMVFLLNRLKPINPLPQATIDRSVSIKQKVDSIYRALRERNKLNFNDILKNAGSRTEVIVSFLALLELVKQEKASIYQDGAFSAMMVKKV